jgi:hypothetical protein
VDVDAERPLAKTSARAFRQRPRDGDGLTVGQGARHARHATR